MFVITDESTRSEIAEALTHMGAHARRQQHHLDCNAWTKAHAQLDAMLTDWEAAS